MERIARKGGEGMETICIYLALLIVLSVINR